MNPSGLKKKRLWARRGSEEGADLETWSEGFSEVERPEESTTP